MVSIRRSGWIYTWYSIKRGRGKFLYKFPLWGRSWSTLQKGEVTTRSNRSLWVGRIPLVTGLSCNLTNNHYPTYQRIWLWAKSDPDSQWGRHTETEGKGKVLDYLQFVPGIVARQYGEGERGGF